MKKIPVPAACPKTPLNWLFIAIIASASGGCSLWDPLTEQSEPARITSLSAESTKSSPAKRLAKLSDSGKINPLPPEQVGYYMDVQYANLQQKLSRDDIDLSLQNSKITMIIPGTNTFDVNSTSVNKDAQSALTAIAGVLAEYDRTIVTVAGHTDNQGETDYNQGLSEQRALAIGEYLSQRGITPTRLVIQCFGQNRPIADNSIPSGRAENRRVELIIEPIVARQSSS